MLPLRVFGILWDICWGCVVRRLRLVAIALTCMSLWSGASVSAAEEQAAELPPPFTVAGKMSHAVQKYSGLTFLANALTSALATAAVSSYVRGAAGVKVRSYNASDLWQGEFRSIEIKLKRGKMHGVPIGSVRLRTTTPFKVSYLPWRKTKRGLTTPVLVAVEGDISEQLVSKALRSKSVSENLRFLKLDLPGLGEQRLQILQPRVRVLGDKVEVKAHLITAGGAPDTGIDLVINGKPVLEKERFIILKDIQIESSDIRDPSEFAVFVEELLNPLIDFGRMDRETHAFRLTELSVKNDRVHFAGRLLLAPRPKPKQAEPMKNS